MLFRSRSAIISVTLVGAAVLVGAWLTFSPRPDPSAARTERARTTAADPSQETGRGYPSRQSAASNESESANGRVRPPAATALELAQPTPPAVIAPFTGVMRDRERADRVREVLTAQLSNQLAALDSTGAPDSIPLPEGDGNQADKPAGQYIAKIMREQFVPMAGDCYSELLTRRAGLAGSIALEFSIMGDSAVGGVVVDVTLGEGTTLKDSEFETCLTESMYGVIFAAPPPGHPTLTVTQSLDLAP